MRPILDHTRLRGRLFAHVSRSEVCQQTPGGTCHHLVGRGPFANCCRLVPTRTAAPTRCLLPSCALQRAPPQLTSAPEMFGTMIVFACLRLLPVELPTLDIAPSSSPTTHDIIEASQFVSSGPPIITAAPQPVLAWSLAVSGAVASQCPTYCQEGLASPSTMMSRIFTPKCSAWICCFYGFSLPTDST